MTNILILQPIRPSNPPELRAQADQLLARLEGANPGLSFDIAQDDSTVPMPPHPSLYMRHATVRNYMLDTYLKPEHTHVLWIDSDLIDYPADLPSVLMEEGEEVQYACANCEGDETTVVSIGGKEVALCECGQAWVVPGVIVAPFAMLDRWPNRFYDIGGFIENGNRARMWPPFFEQDGAVVELDSVGCCYLAPAELYRGSAAACAARYAPPPTDYYVEHWSVMQEAKKRGYRVVALRDVRVIHAWLPDYGLGVN